MWEQGVLAWRFRAARTAGLYRRALSDSVPEPPAAGARRVRTSRSADRAFFALDILRFGVRLLRLYSIFRCLALRSLFALLSIGCDRGRTMRPCESCTTSTSRPDTRADGKKRPAATQARPRAGSLLSPYNPPEGHTSKTKRPHRHISRVLGGTSVARVSSKTLCVFGDQVSPHVHHALTP